MSGPTYLVQPNIIRLPQLLEELWQGEIQIPRFQRPFVWTADQRLLLFESIYQGMPIGGILVWRTREHNLRCIPNLGHLQLGGSSDENARGDTVRQYLLDGHQRLTTLYTALGEGLFREDERGVSEGGPRDGNTEEPEGLRHPVRGEEGHETQKEHRQAAPGKDERQFAEPDRQGVHHWRPLPTPEEQRESCYGEEEASDERSCAEIH